jgi:hypothetical protein
MEVRYYLNPDSGEPHIYEHGVTEEEVEAVLRRPGEDLPAKDGARQALGQTAAGVICGSFMCLTPIRIASS